MISKACNQQQVRATGEALVSLKRDDKIEKSYKWDDFRDRRKVVMDAYIHAKKQSVFVRRFNILQKLNKFMHTSREAFAALKHKRLIRFYGTRLSMVLFIKMRKQIMRHGTLQCRWKNYIRSDFTFMS